MEIVSFDLHYEVDDLVRKFTDGLHIDNADEEDDQKSLPTPRKSAMKGSRERRGITPSKMNVKWDPEVYDPIPRRSRKQKKQHKSDNYNKNGKEGQRNNLAKASNGGGMLRVKQFVVENILLSLLFSIILFGLYFYLQFR